ncbi:YTH domain-containing protein 1-like [Penaeus monodon]|uniref:YTH domain-containing protein 1-like n=1 Tax=Penaeus monodon TaxID=6687 RepID=UPI0018A71525|nr:YTH domain-containing protein 1-like [Penaeus monodon]
MRALQVSVLVATALLAALESGVVAAPRGTYSYRTVHQASSSNNALTPSRTRGLAGTSRQNGLDRETQRSPYSPVDYTPEVKSARNAFFKLYDKQAKLAKAAPDLSVDGRYSFSQRLPGPAAEDDDHQDDIYYYYYYDDEEHDSEEEEYEFEDEEDDEEEESHEGDEEDDDDDDDEDEDDDDDDEEEEESHEEDEDDSEEGDDSSEEDGADSSSEEGADSSSEEGGVSSSEEEDGFGGESSSEESSEEGDDGDDSSSSSSSSSEEDGAGGFDIASWGRRNTNALLARTPRPVTDTPEVKQEKRNFFRLYKKQAELAFNAPDH